MDNSNGAFTVWVLSRRDVFTSGVLAALREMGTEGRVLEDTPEGLGGVEGLLIVDGVSIPGDDLRRAALRASREGGLEIEFLREPDPFAVELAVLRCRLNLGMREDLDKYRSSFLTLNAVVHALNRPLSDEEALPSALRELAHHFGGRRYALFRAADPGSSPELRYYHDLPVELVARLRSEEGKAALSHVFNTILSVVDVIDGETLLRIEPRAVSWLSFLEERGHEAPNLLLFTLKSNRRPVGMVSMAFDRPRAWNAREKETLSLIGQQLGLVLENAMLFEGVQAARREWEATVDSLRDMVFLASPSGMIVRANRALGEFTGIPLRELMGKVCAEALACGRDPGDCNFRLRALGGGTESYEISDGKGKDYRVLVTPFLSGAEGSAGTVHLVSDITEEKALLRLEEEKRQLEELDRLKDRFMASVTHELKTPLNAIIGFSELLLSGTYGGLEERQRRYLENIHAGGRHLLSLITDILDYMRLQADSLSLHGEEVDVGALMRSTADIMRPEAAHGGIALRVEVEDGTPPVTADRRRVTQVLFNLLSNAIKFTPRGGRVTLRALTRPQGVVMEVEDTGVGISAEDQRLLFTEFTQVGEGARRGGGTGLGLALSRKLVELHGGSIWVRSEPGRGSTFSFLLPFAPYRENAQEKVKEV